MHLRIPQPVLSLGIADIVNNAGVADRTWLGMRDKTYVPANSISPCFSPERGCVVLDQPQRRLVVGRAVAGLRHSRALKCCLAFLSAVHPAFLRRRTANLQNRPLSEMNRSLGHLIIHVRKRF